MLLASLCLWALDIYGRQSKGNTAYGKSHDLWTKGIQKYCAILKWNNWFCLKFISKLHFFQTSNDLSKKRMVGLYRYCITIFMLPKQLAEILSQTTYQVDSLSLKKYNHDCSPTIWLGCVLPKVDTADMHRLHVGLLSDLLSWVHY